MGYKNNGSVGGISQFLEKWPTPTAMTNSDYGNYSTHKCGMNAVMMLFGDYNQALKKIDNFGRIFSNGLFA